MSHLAALILVASLGQPAPGDLLIADFEWERWSDRGWTATGDAFGPGPARGPLHGGQKSLKGYEGERLVNSYFDRDRSTGELTSPPFTVERPYINLLVGGGGHAGRTCVNLLIDGRVVHTATGSNTRPGGSEALEWRTWDVRAFLGREAVIQVLDRVTTGWGHINVDHIMQSNERREPEPVRRDFTIDKPYLWLPIARNGIDRWMSFYVDGNRVRQFAIAPADGEPDDWVFTDTSAFLGRTLTVECALPAGSAALDAIRLADERPHADTVYREALRPQYHFTSRIGWLNDPNGLVYADGEYHLFYQHNPFSTRGANKVWGHAVSTDMLHWRELDTAIHQDALGLVFSGTAVVDARRTAGFPAGDADTLVAVYTAAPGVGGHPWSLGKQRAQSIAWSNDRGRTFHVYPDNPVVGNIYGNNRDPKVFWHAPTQRWVMMLYVDRGRFDFLTSPDLKTWTPRSTLDFPDGYECPDLFELPVDGDGADLRWVAWEGRGLYLLGDFDGETFTITSGPHAACFGKNDYAAQTFNHAPLDRVVQISWMRGGQYPDMPFNQQMTVPRELSLRTTGEGVRLFIEPIKELKTLRGHAQSRRDLTLTDTPTPLDWLADKSLDVEVTIDPGSATRVGLNLFGGVIEYDAAKHELHVLGSVAPLKPENGRVSLRILADRVSFEVFANGGRVQLATCLPPGDARDACEAYAVGGGATLVSLDTWTMRSIWHDDESTRE